MGGRKREGGWKVDWGHSGIGLDIVRRNVDLIPQTGRAPEEFLCRAERNSLSTWSLFRSSSF